jgi:DNA-binding MarR family transcriptional regulator
VKYGSEDSALLQTLLQVTSVAMGSLGAQLTHLKLNPTELNVLANLADGTPRRVGMLARTIGVRPSTLTGILDRLQGRDLLTRIPHPADRRSWPS